MYVSNSSSPSTLQPPQPKSIKEKAISGVNWLINFAALKGDADKKNPESAENKKLFEQRFTKNSQDLLTKLIIPYVKYEYLGIKNNEDLELHVERIILAVIANIAKKIPDNFELQLADIPATLAQIARDTFEGRKIDRQKAETEQKRSSEDVDSVELAPTCTQEQDEKCEVEVSRDTKKTFNPSLDLKVQQVYETLLVTMFPGKSEDLKVRFVGNSKWKSIETSLDKHCKSAAKHHANYPDTHERLQSAIFDTTTDPRISELNGRYAKLRIEIDKRNNAFTKKDQPTDDEQNAHDREIDQLTLEYIQLEMELAAKKAQVYDKTGAAAWASEIEEGACKYICDMIKDRLRDEKYARSEVAPYIASLLKKKDVRPTEQEIELVYRQIQAFIRASDIAEGDVKEADKKQNHEDYAGYKAIWDYLRSLIRATVPKVLLNINDAIKAQKAFTADTANDSPSQVSPYPLTTAGADVVKFVCQLAHDDKNLDKKKLQGLYARNIKVLFESFPDETWLSVYDEQEVAYLRQEKAKIEANGGQSTLPRLQEAHRHSSVDEKELKIAHYDQQEAEQLDFDTRLQQDFDRALINAFKPLAVAGLEKIKGSNLDSPILSKDPISDIPVSGKPKTTTVQSKADAEKLAFWEEQSELLATYAVYYYKQFFHDDPQELSEQLLSKFLSHHASTLCHLLAVMGRDKIPHLLLTQHPQNAYLSSSLLKLTQPYLPNAKEGWFQENLDLIGQAAAKYRESQLPDQPKPAQDKSDEAFLSAWNTIAESAEIAMLRMMVKLSKSLGDLDRRSPNFLNDITPDALNVVTKHMKQVNSKVGEKRHLHQVNTIKVDTPAPGLPENVVKQARPVPPAQVDADKKMKELYAVLAEEFISFVGITPKDVPGGEKGLEILKYWAPSLIKLVYECTGTPQTLYGTIAGICNSFEQDVKELLNKQKSFDVTNRIEDPAARAPAANPQPPGGPANEMLPADPAPRDPWDDFFKELNKALPSVLAGILNIRPFEDKPSIRQLTAANTRDKLIPFFNRWKPDVILNNNILKPTIGALHTVIDDEEGRRKGICKTRMRNWLNPVGREVDVGDFTFTPWANENARRREQEYNQSLPEAARRRALQTARKIVTNTIWINLYGVRNRIYDPIAIKAGLLSDRIFGAYSPKVRYAFFKCIEWISMAVNFLIFPITCLVEYLVEKYAEWQLRHALDNILHPVNEHMWVNLLLLFFEKANPNGPLAMRQQAKIAAEELQRAQAAVDQEQLVHEEPKPEELPPPPYQEPGIPVQVEATPA